MHDELGCATAAAAMYATILDDADTKAWAPPEYDNLDPEVELRKKLPWLLGRLSPKARAMMRDHLAHNQDLVAGFHRMMASQPG
jgi:hypothetical protein